MPVLHRVWGNVNRLGLVSVFGDSDLVRFTESGCDYLYPVIDHLLGSASLG